MDLSTEYSPVSERRNTLRPVNLFRESDSRNPVSGIPRRNPLLFRSLDHILRVRFHHPMACSSPPCIICSKRKPLYLTYQKACQYDSKYTGTKCSCISVRCKKIHLPMSGTSSLFAPSENKKSCIYATILNPMSFCRCIGDFL